MRERSEMKNTGKRTGRKIIKIILGILGGILLSCAVVFAIYKLAIDPHRDVNHSAVESLPLDEMITTAQAIEDIDYVMKMFRDRHPAWLEEGNTRVADVENCYIEEIGELKSSGKAEISVLEEWQIISRIMHCLYDGHSTVYSNRSDVKYLEDFSMIRSYRPERTAALRK